MAQPFDIFMAHQLADNEIELLPISLAHLGVVSALPLYHRDPFDRLLIAQAMIEQTPIVGADAAFNAYSVTRLW
ncbi:MAG TPA: type II toxin-antitoxin system VapC family toxin [Pyrinomonadaceae bacterium]|nr:type II toxin-antitoxin system VapC family toxin [Pyrinomonadaceae bacterium]